MNKKWVKIIETMVAILGLVLLFSTTCFAIVKFIRIVIAKSTNGFQNDIQDFLVSGNILGIGTWFIVSFEIFTSMIKDIWKNNK